MNTDKDTKNEHTPIKEKRQRLSELSRQAIDLKKKLIREAQEAGQANKALYWASRTINFMLLKYFYETDGATEFKTFPQWKQENATVKKGAKAFIVWGQPLGSREEDEPSEETTAMYFPLCYLFSDRQVVKPADRVSKEPEQDTEPEPAKMEAITDDIF